MKRCHLCGTPYNDDPFFREQPAHTPNQCIGILQYRRNEAERNLSDIKQMLARAKKEYAEAEGKNE